MQLDYLDFAEWKDSLLSSMCSRTEFDNVLATCAFVTRPK